MYIFKISIANNVYLQTISVKESLDENIKRYKRCKIPEKYYNR